jgi:hypothetical protein
MSPVARRRSVAIVVATLLIVLCLLLLPACCCVRAPQASSSIPAMVIPPIATAPLVIPPAAEQAGPTESFMRNVDFHIDETTVLRIHELRGQMFDKEHGKPLNFDDRRTFILRIFEATIGLQSPGLDNLMNRYVFGYPGAPLRAMSATFVGNKLRQEGIMHKVIDIPFTMMADVSATPDGWIRIHPTRIEICNLNGGALMKALGVTLEKMLDLSKAHGVRAEGNDLLLEPQVILPPPQIDGHLSEVRVEGDELVLHFTSPTAPAALTLPEPGARNTMYFRHGILRMGKLLMIDADMQVIDNDPSDPFDFFIDRYNEQLVAGRDQSRLDYGLTVYMRDFNDLGKPLRSGERAK